MAYLTFLASVPFLDIKEFRSSRREPLDASLQVACSHLVAYWVEVQPLGRLLGRAIDGGEALAPDLRHPLRPPLVHDPAAVQEINKDLQAEWARVIQERGLLDDDDWYVIEITKVLKVFDHASSQGEAILSMLDNQERAPKLTIRLKEKSSPKRTDSLWDREIDG